MVNLVELAARMGLNWSELAKVIGISRQYLSMIHGGATPSSITAKRIELLWDEWKDKFKE